MHLVLPNHFKNVFSFQLSLSSKLSLLLVEKVSLFYKKILVSKGKVFQNSLNIFPFHKESNFNPFLNSILFKLYLWNGLKQVILQKVWHNRFRKTKVLIFHQQSGFQTKDLWLSFVLKAFDFISRAKFLLKFNLVLKEKKICQ